MIEVQLFPLFVTLCIGNVKNTKNKFTKILTEIPYFILTYNVSLIRRHIIVFYKMLICVLHPTEFEITSYL